MNMFGNYARYYDLLYKDKNYAGEADYVHGIIQKYAPGALSILELGCGTAAHARFLIEKGYRLHGVDRSPEMLERARKGYGAMPSGSAAQISFSEGDIRNMRLTDRYDVVISLFHVMSYQATNGDLLAAFATAKEHLRPSGIFIFDCWYGPAVLTDRPARRVKHFEDESISVVRTAEPVIHPNDNLVDVNYHVAIRDKASGTIDELRETHRMRYLFRPELEILMAANGMKILEGAEWMSGRAPGFETWNVCFVGSM